MMFTTPKGIDFRSVQNNLGSTVKDTMDKLNVDEFRTNEMWTSLTNNTTMCV